MDIKLNPEDFREHISAAILSQVTDEKRNTLIQGAISYLITPAMSGYRTGTTPLQDAFNQALNMVARGTLEEMLKNDERVKGMVTKLINDAFTRALTDDYDNMVDEVSKSIASAMKFKKDY